LTRIGLTGNNRSTEEICNYNRTQGTVVGILTPLEPWAGLNAPGIEEEVCPVRPWYSPENQQEIPENQKNSKHPSVVKPPEYDEYARAPP
jgi:hypothetical protein